MSGLNYKRYHEEFMQNLNGTSSAEVFLLILPAPVCLYLSNFMLVLCLPSMSSPAISEKDTKIKFLVDFTVIILPVILCVTVLSEYHVILTSGILMGLCACLAFCWITQSEKVVSADNFATSIKKSRIPCITVYRSVTNLMSVICILAVDFKVFPRRFAKTENFGYSLMDTGVGLFMISNSLVEPQGKLETSVLKSVRSCVSLIVLGGARFFATKQIDYQTHISEYGVHWNFFITLAAARILCTLILNITRGINTLLLPVIVVSAHQVMLSSGLQDWVLSDVPRQDFLSANREGIVSSLGYVALYFAGVCFGKELKSSGASLRSVGKLSVASVLLWCIASLCRDYFGVSRRMANVGYFTWIMALSVSLIVVVLCLELSLRGVNVACLNAGYIPLTLDAINYNGLAFFLLANLFTGVINMCAHTLYLEPLPSVMIICGYMFVLCWLILQLYVKQIKLKI